ncbi:MAG: bifunctional sugar-1-phosphate nucleotidylyltransferase/acetyltransferase [Candidatus Hermodarchaeota archaeon]
MKAVILAAGKGKRLMPITSSRPKPMIPLANKPMLEYTILGLKNSGINEILLIVGYKEEVIREYFGNGQDKFNININYITQEKQLGTGNAVSFAKDFVNNEPFLLMYGDLMIDPKIFKEVLEKFNNAKIEGLISLLEVNNPQEFGVISLNSDGYVERITEKPIPELNLGNLVNAGIYIFDPLIFKAIERTKKSIRGEYEFTDSMQILIDELGGNILGYIIKDYFWSDIGLPWQLFDANSFVLDRIERKILGKIEENVHIFGNVYIGKNANVKSGSYIQGPCYIGENTLIGPNAFLRPYTSVGDNCHIGISEVKNSLIFSKSNVPHFNYVGDSIVCENVNLGAGSKTSNLRFDNKSVKVTIEGKLIDSGRRKLGAFIGPNVQTGINASVMCGKKIGENSVIGAHTLVVEDVAANTLYYHDPYEGIKMKENPFY